MINKIVILFTVIVSLTVEIEAEDCPFLTLKLVNVTQNYTYSHLVWYYGECYYSDRCHLSRWETRVKNKTIEKATFVRDQRCCESPVYDYDEDRVYDLLKCIPEGNVTGWSDEISNVINGTSADTDTVDVFKWLRTTSTENPESSNNDTEPYFMLNRTLTEENYETRPTYRTTSTERSYNDTAPYYRGNTTSTERSSNDTAPSYRRYTTSTERSYNDTAPSYPRYRPSRVSSHSDTAPSYPRYRPSRVSSHNDTAPSYRGNTTSTERSYNDTAPSYPRYRPFRESSHSDTAPSYRGYTTSTEKSYKDPAPYYTYHGYNITAPSHTRRLRPYPRRRYYVPPVRPYYPEYTTTTQTPNYGLEPTVSYTWSYTTTTKRPDYGPVYRDHKRGFNISTDEKVSSSNMNGTDSFQSHDRKNMTSPGVGRNNEPNRTEPKAKVSDTSITDLIGSLPDINPPYNWNDRRYINTYGRRPYTQAYTEIYEPFTSTTPSIDPTIEKKPTVMWVYDLLKCIPEGNVTGWSDEISNVINGTSADTDTVDVFKWLRTTSTENPESSNNDTEPYFMLNRTLTEENYETRPTYRTTSTERSYNDTAPYYRGNTTSTERSSNDTAPSYRRYTTSTERSYNDTAPSYPRYRPSRVSSHSDTAPSYPRYRPSRVSSHNDTAPSYRGNTTSTERSYNDTAPSYPRYRPFRESSHSDTAPSYRGYTTSTEKSYKDPAPYYTYHGYNITAPSHTRRLRPYPRRRYYVPPVRPYYPEYTTTTQTPNYGLEPTVSYTWSYTTTTKRPDYGPVYRDHKRGFNISTDEKVSSSNMNGTDSFQSHDRKNMTSPGVGRNNEPNRTEPKAKVSDTSITDLIGSLPDINPPYNWNDRRYINTYGRRPYTQAYTEIYEPFTSTTPSIDPTIEKKPTVMW
ncbi:unnamed protein product [Chrysodeixis includens]|uniref:Adhesive plaque matrix protein-like n=1 Tax=Chrysodeixis includens TaxID=689277 RepID=A0A9N8PZ25_CHRIL|nr:unnamed protein product [Chrysodeixis includens]